MTLKELERVSADDFPMGDGVGMELAKTLVHPVTIHPKLLTHHLPLRN